MTNTNTEITTQSTQLMESDGITAVDMIDALKNPTGDFFCSITGDDRKTKVAIYNAVNNAEDTLANHINEVITVVDVAAYPVQLVDETTGEIFTALRTVLIDDKGKAYSAVSQGILNSLQRIFAIIGMPSWKDDPIKVKVKQVQTRNGANKVNILELV